ncbi:MAG: inorganic phosphate transporter [Bacteroidetes bacterium GWE2_29_8]|nr:MAG: inorganic phosphate transporter [Bacteroidetes bacterium GWE2_29_8]OFY21751.1 MAG: inorganic phosphate transporter [Bacteroidetes bacterium GWF2_29_10]
MFIIVVIAIVIALLFDFLNGMNDAANSIATIVATKVLSPLKAVLWAAFFNFIAYFLFGVHVANTIGKGIVEPVIVDEFLILSSLVGAVLWVYACTKFGMPISVSHALIGGLIGPTIIKAQGFSMLISSGIFKVLLFIVLSPLIGFLLGFIIMAITLHFSRNSIPSKVDKKFRYLQLFSSAIFSLGHGSNDAQKTMGIIAILLYSYKKNTLGLPDVEFSIPGWVIFVCYLTISLGTITGGWSVIKTLGAKLTDLKPVGGFCAETAGALTIIGSSLGGIPVSTTHTITGSIIGVGITKRFSAVRWGLTTHIVGAWILTIPATAIMSALVYMIIRFFT